jgi:PIN domain nuclease of toxin-antitoxin system
MNLFLDTHILLWSLLDPGQLTPVIAATLTHPDNTLWISPVTTREILVLSDKQRLQLDRDPASTTDRRNPAFIQ